MFQEEKFNSMDIGYLLSDLEGNVLYHHNEKKVFNSASTIKTLIMCAALDKIMSEQSDLDKFFEISHNNTFINKRESIIFYDKTINYRKTLKELISWMIKISDNACTDILIEWIGFENINKYGKSIGLKNTTLNRYMTSYATSDETFNYKQENYTTLEDMYILFKLIFEQEILNKDYCTFAMKVLFDQRLNSKIPRFLYQEIEFAHKTGGLSCGVSVCNDVGIIIKNTKKYFIGVFIENQKDNEENLQNIGLLGKELYDNIK